MKREWKDNAFWDNEEKTQIKAILEIVADDGVKTSQVMTIRNDNNNPDWKEVLDVIGEDVLNKNTEDRKEKKFKEEEALKLREQDIKLAKKLEDLFEAKLEAFNVEEIKKSTNRDLKSRLRRSKSIYEVNLYATMIMMESIENESGE
jgi:hypothetical protein